MTDFGADGAFVGAAARLKEHYGIEVPMSAIRWITEEHGEAMRAQEKHADWRNAKWRGANKKGSENKHLDGGSSGDSRAHASNEGKYSTRKPRGIFATCVEYPL
jgi:hypothetical protein